MRKRILTFLMVVGITTSSFSQTSYPARILFQNDTVVALKQDQLIKVNRALNDYRHLKKVHALSLKEKDTMDSLLHYYHKSCVSQQGIINKQEEKFKNQETLYEEYIKELKKKSRKKSIGVGVGSVILGFILGVLLK